MPQIVEWLRTPGFLVGLVLIVAFFLTFFLRAPQGGVFEARGPGSFEPGLARYIRLVEFVVGLSTGSIVLLASSSAFRSGGKLPKSYGSPLVLLTMSVALSVGFLALMVHSYERSLHDPKLFSGRIYALINALGFSALLCFALGYLWLGISLVQG